MGGLLSINHPRPTASFHAPHTESCKRLKTTSLSHFWDDNPRLIPCLPDEISIQILARIPRICYLNFKAVSRSWKSALTSHEIYKIRKELGTTEEWLYIMTKNQGDYGICWHALDPVSKRWQRLPPIPNACVEDGYEPGLSGSRMWNMVGSSIRVTDAMRGWLGLKDSSDQISYRTCSIAAVDGCLYMLGGMSVSRVSSVTHVWKYDPISNCWSEVNPMSVGRVYCEAGVLNNKLFVVGGLSLARGEVDGYSLTPLQSAEVFDPQTGLWSEIPSMPCSKAHAIAAAFLADFYFEPYTTGLASYRGKLYVPQSLYHRPFVVGVGGEVYDPETNSWVDMPTGMGEGWPACLGGGTKRSVIVDGDLYALHRGLSSVGAKVKVYNHRNDSWKEVEGDIPLCEGSLYLPTVLLRKLHVVTVDDHNNIVVMRAEKRDGLTASLDEGDSESMPTSESYIWNVIASGNFRFGRLEGCQNLDV